MFLALLLLIVGVIWLIVWAIRKFTRNSPSPLQHPKTNLSERSARYHDLSTPRALDGAVIFINEESISTESPRPLHGKPDQVFRLTNGVLLPVETKNRARARFYLSDQIQLSAYATILRGNGHVVANWGYVRVPRGPRDAVWLEVPLFNDLQLEKIVDHYHDIRSGRVVPTCLCGNH